ncbi:MAG: efflux RND transporter periplasmic adaptor subunit [Candidatus Acidiferrales bacterium]
MSLRESYQQHKKLYLIGAAVLIVLIASWSYARSRANDPKFTTAEVRTGNITASVQATGTINALTTVPVGSYVSGTVEYIFADYNTRVHSGQVLAQLDPAIYEAQVTQARGNLENAQANLVTLAANIQVDQANLAKSEANVKYEEATAKRSQDLFVSGVVSADSNDLTQSNLGQAQADVQSAQAELDQAKATLAQARSQVVSMDGALKAAETSLKYTTIISPIDGTVVARNVDVGQSVAATLQAPQVFTVAQDLTRMQVYAATDESDTGNIKVGTPVTFQVDAFPTQLFHGRVSIVRLNPTTVQNVVTYNTVIDFSNPDEKLLPGETAYVTIPTGHAQNATLIPNPALTFKPSMPSKEIQALYKQYNISREASSSHLGGWQVVWKLGPDHKQLIPVAVQAGITDYNNTQLLQGDLHPGDVLVVAEQAKGTSGNVRPPGFGGGGPR